MNLTKNNYKKRLIDDKLAKYLKTFSAIYIVGPKWCGKTWTALNHANSVIFLDKGEERELVKLNHNIALNGTYPRLIDEWQNIPSLWDDVRHKCDEDDIRGKFILTGSANINRLNNEEISHTGIGRIIPMKMFTMSLYESGHSNGEISITDMYENKDINLKTKNIELIEIAKLIINGGWPSNVETNDHGLVAKQYYNSIINIDIYDVQDLGYKKNPIYVKSILKSIARNESTPVKINTILNDLKEVSNDDNLINDRRTLIKYLSFLENLFIFVEHEPFSLKYRSSARLSKATKKHLIDPSLSCAALGLTVNKLMNDLNTFGFMFEALVERDLRIYADYLDANIYHFRDNTSGNEVDTIIEFEDGEYGAFEIKLGIHKIDEAKKSLMTFYNNVERKPKFMCIIVGNVNYAFRDQETGIYIIPINSLRP